MVCSDTEKSATVATVKCSGLISLWGAQQLFIQNNNNNQSPVKMESKTGRSTDLGSVSKSLVTVSHAISSVPCRLSLNWGPSSRQICINRSFTPLAQQSKSMKNYSEVTLGSLLEKWKWCTQQYGYAYDMRVFIGVRKCSAILSWATIHSTRFLVAKVWNKND